MKNKLLLILLFATSMTFAQNDPTADRWEDNGSSTDISLPSNGQVNITGYSTIHHGIVHVTSTGHHLYAERGLKIEASDDSASYFAVDNGTQKDGRFQAVVRGHYGTDYTQGQGGGVGLFLYSSINPDLDYAGSSTTMMSFEVRASNNEVFNASDNAVQNLDLFRWRNLDQVLMLMNKDGNLGINTSSPTAKLHVNGSVRFENLSTGTGTKALVADANGNVYANSLSSLNTDYDWYVSNNGSTTTNQPTSISDDLWTDGRVGIGGAALTSATPSGYSNPISITLTVYGNSFASGGQWTASDRRYKENIEKISSAKKVLDGLTGYSYDFKQDNDLKFPSSKQYGLIAQDIQKVLPEAVTQLDVKGKQILVVNYQMIIPFLVEGYKQQQNQLESQKSELEELKSELNDIKSSLSANHSSSINESDQNASGIVVYPNPTSGIINFDLSAFSNPKGKTLRIYGIDGKLIISKSLSDEKLISIDLSSKEKGYYTAVIFDGANILQSQKFIIQ